MAPFDHKPVMLKEILQLVRAQEAPVRRIVDCTVGGAGHAQALLEHCAEAELLALDRDPAAVNVAQTRLAVFAGRATVVHSPFAQAKQHVMAMWGGPADVVLADFGVSSHQLDEGDRGFSFRFDAPLDMRMDTSSGSTALQLCAQSDVDALTDILRRLGEERYARRIARAIVASPPSTTWGLRDLVHRSVPKSHERIDPATRTFMALRMAVNDELGQIDSLLRQISALLAPSGLFMALSFHSLEDRAVKVALRSQSIVCTCPRLLPRCGCGHRALLRVRPGKALRPSEAETLGNPRARSTRLRVAYRLNDGPA